MFIYKKIKSMKIAQIASCVKKSQQTETTDWTAILPIATPAPLNDYLENYSGGLDWPLHEGLAGMRDRYLKKV
jgi:hypothetical protein